MATQNLINFCSYVVLMCYLVSSLPKVKKINEKEKKIDVAIDKYTERTSYARKTVKQVNKYIDKSTHWSITVV